MQKYLEMVNIKWSKFVCEKNELQMLQSTPDARSIVTGALGNCNILQNNVMISIVCFKKKRNLTIWTDYLFPDRLMRPKTIQFILCSRAPEQGCARLIFSG